MAFWCKNSENRSDRKSDIWVPLNEILKQKKPHNSCSEHLLLLFTEIIKGVDAVGVIPKLICVHVHAVLTGAIIWLTGEPVCVVQGCPIAPYPVSL